MDKLCNHPGRKEGRRKLDDGRVWEGKGRGREVRRGRRVGAGWKREEGRGRKGRRRSRRDELRREK